MIPDIMQLEGSAKKTLKKKSKTSKKLDRELDSDEEKLLEEIQNDNVIEILDDSEDDDYNPTPRRKDAPPLEPIALEKGKTKKKAKKEEKKSKDGWTTWVNLMLMKFFVILYAASRVIARSNGRW